MIQKISIASQVSNPIPEDILIKKEMRKLLLISLFLLLSDMIICNIINVGLIYYCKNISKKNQFRFELFFVLFFIIFVYILLLIKSTIIALISVILYSFFGLVYFIYKLVFLLNLITSDNRENFKEDFYEKSDLIFLFLNLVTLILRIFIVLYLKNFIDNLNKIDELNRLIEHEKFIEDLGDKIDNGNNTRWSYDQYDNNDDNDVVLKFNN
jgi:hypothetical protein